MNAMKEKRQFDRINFGRKVQVFPVLPSSSGNIYEVQKESFEVQAGDISEGGLSLETDRFSGTPFLVKLNFEVGKDRSVEVYGKIIWTQGKRCGIRFMLADAELRKGVRDLARNTKPASN